MKKILVPVDGSRYSDIAMEKAKKIAEAFGSQITLVHVNDFALQPFSYNRELEESFKAKFEELSRDLLEEGKGKFGEMADRVETVYLEGHIANAIIDYANENDFDLIVMGPHGKGRMKGFLIGSTAHKISLHVKTSVMIARDPAQDSKEEL
ncbi:MAG: universal stress protein [Anaerovoracaceae bacterium]|jgi:nucleotide-binding universal stress UspA family protein